MAGSIELYQGEDGQFQLDVRFENETVWLSQKQMAELFEKDSDTIGLHLKNTFQSGELEEKSTTEEYSVVQTEGKRSVKRKIKFYNLDAIISVGYRVNSKRGTQFRIWATQVLREHLVQGYTLNQKRLVASEEKYRDLTKAIRLISRTTGNKSLASQEARGILEVLERYAFALDTLDKYDHQRLELPVKEAKETWRLTYEDAIRQIARWRAAQKAGPLFGNEKDASFRSSLETIYQTFDGKDLYPSLEEKAAHLLYFIIKNHSFTDGNKRIAAGLFVYFLDRNSRLFHPDGSKIIGDNALVAMTLLLAESDPEEKETMIRVVVNLM